MIHISSVVPPVWNNFTDAFSGVSEASFRGGVCVPSSVRGCEVLKNGHTEALSSDWFGLVSVGFLFGVVLAWAGGLAGFVMFRGNF